MIVFIKHKGYRLSKRKAIEVNNLAEFAQSLSMPEGETTLSAETLKNSLIISSQIILDSIKATYKNFSFIKKIFAFRYRRLLAAGVFPILDNLTPEDMGIARRNIAEMEDSKKKVVEAGKFLDET